VHFFEENIQLTLCHSCLSLEVCWTSGVTTLLELPLNVASKTRRLFQHVIT
jgi:hypothetical protein